LQNFFVSHDVTTALYTFAGFHKCLFETVVEYRTNQKW